MCLKTLISQICVEVRVMSTFCTCTVVMLRKEGSGWKRSYSDLSLSWTETVPWFGVWATSRLTEVCMHPQNPISWVDRILFLLAVWFCNDYQWRNPVLCSLVKISLNILWWLTELCPKTYDSVFNTCLVFIPKVTLCRCMRGGCTGVRPGGPGTVCAAKGTQWDNMGCHWKHINHGSHYQCCQVFVLVIYFQVFCFSNLILSPCCLTVNC